MDREIRTCGPPLEGFWPQENVVGIDYTQREFSMISVISLLDFVLVHAYRIL